MPHMSWGGLSDIILVLLAFVFVTSEGINETNTRRMTFNKVRSGGCPYTASFLIDARTYAKIHWGLKWQKMEAANWHAMDACKKRFQFRGPKEYFVNHMSALEHSTRKKLGYNVSEANTLTFSNAAKAGECGAVGEEFDRNTLAILPFYGGRPPGVKTDISGALKVTSIGQGNSLIKAEIKALQTMAVLCSVLKYFSYVIVGVARTEDADLIKSEVALLGSYIASRVHVQLLTDLHKPANLPFHLLEHAKEYIRRVNSCIDQLPVEETNVPNICNEHFTSFVDAQKANLSLSMSWRIKYLYYTESDQIVKFRDNHVRDAVIGATNITTMIVGRRLEKDWQSAPGAYMQGLVPTRAVCGEPFYVMEWPTSQYIYKVNSTEESSL